MIDMDRFTPVDETLIPTGEIKSVDDAPLDFRTPTSIGERIDQDDRQLRYCNGYDHNYVLNREEDEFRSRAARVHDPSSGRTLTVHTTKPGLQFYSGNFLKGRIPGKEKAEYVRHSGFRLEPQYFPDAPNQSRFPSPVLKPDETYRHSSSYEYGVRPE